MRLIFVVLVAFMGMFSFSCVSPKGILVQDDFEYELLSDSWRKDKFLEKSIIFQKNQVRSGSLACGFVLTSGDQILKEVGTNFERAELKESKKFYSVEKKTYQYNFSIFLPEDFPTTPNRLVIAQWKQNCVLDNCTPDNPILAFRYVNGVFFITKQTDLTRDTLYTGNSDIRNQWLDFEVHTRFSSKAEGQLTVYLNRQKVVDFKGKTAYSQNGLEYVSPNMFYFKMGLYRDSSTETMTIYMDDYVKRIVKK